MCYTVSNYQMGRQVGLLMTNILLTVIALMIAGLGGAFFAVLLYVRREYRDLRSQIVDFLTPVDEGQPSPLANVAQVTADMLGRSVAAQVKGTLMGFASGAKRGETALSAEVVEGAAEGTPAGSILQLLGGKRTLKRNPALIDLAMQYFASKAGAGPGSSGSGNGHSPKFKL